jgi:hypothetical protein
VNKDTKDFLKGINLEGVPVDQFNNIFNLGEISGSQGGEYEDDGALFQKTVIYIFNLISCPSVFLCRGVTRVDKWSTSSRCSTCGGAK